MQLLHANKPYTVVLAMFQNDRGLPVQAKRSEYGDKISCEVYWHVYEPSLDEYVPASGAMADAMEAAYQDSL